MRAPKHILILLTGLLITSCSGAQQGGNLEGEEEGQIEAPSLGIGSPVDIPVPIAKGMLPVKATSLTLERVVGEEGIAAILRGETQEDNVSVAFFIATDEESGTPAVTKAAARTEPPLVVSQKMEFVDCVPAPGRRFSRRIPVDEIGIPIAIVPTRALCNADVQPGERGPEVIAMVVDRCEDTLYQGLVDNCPEYTISVETTNIDEDTNGGGMILENPFAVSSSLSRTALHLEESSGKISVATLPLDGGDLTKLHRNLSAPMNDLQYAPNGDLYGIDPVTRLIRRIAVDGSSFVEASGEFPADRSLSVSPKGDVASTFTARLANGNATVSILVQTTSGTRFSINPKEVLLSQGIRWMDGNTVAAIQLHKDGVYRLVSYEIAYPSVHQTVHTEENMAISNLCATSESLVTLRDADGKQELIRFDVADDKKVILNDGSIGGVPYFPDSCSVSADGSKILSSGLYKGDQVVTLTYRGHTVIVDRGTEPAILPMQPLAVYLGKSFGGNWQVRVKNLSSLIAKLDAKEEVQEKVEEKEEESEEEEDQEPVVTPEPAVTPVPEEPAPAPKPEPPKEEPPPDGNKVEPPPPPPPPPKPKATTLEISGPKTGEVLKGLQFTASAMNDKGVSVPVDADLPVKLAGSGSGTFYKDFACKIVATQVTIPKGKNKINFCFRTAVAGEYNFTASSPGLKSGSFKLTVLDKPPAMILINGPTIVDLKSCKAYAFSLADASGKVAKTSSDLLVHLRVDGGGSFYKDSQCKTLTQDVTFTKGSSSATASFSSQYTGEMTIIAHKDSLESAPYIVTVAAAPPPPPPPPDEPDPSVFTIEGSNTIGAGTCSEYYVRFYQSDGVTPAWYDRSVSFRADDTGQGTIFSDSTCTVATIGDWNLGTGSSSAQFYYKNTKAETVSLKAFINGTQVDSHVVTVTPGAASRMTLHGPAGISRYACNTYTLITEDNFGNPSSSHDDIPLKIEPDYGKAYDSASCSFGTDTTSVIFPASTSEELFFFTLDSMPPGTNPFTLIIRWGGGANQFDSLEITTTD